MSTLDFKPSQVDNENMIISKYQNYLEENIINALVSFESIEDASMEIDQSEEGCLILLSIKLRKGYITIPTDDKKAIEDYVLKVLTPFYSNPELTIIITN